MLLLPGEYLIVPWMNINEYSNICASSSEHQVTKNDLHTIAARLFRWLDTSLSDLLSKTDLNTFCRLVESQNMSEIVFDWILTTFETKEGALTFHGFYHLLQHIQQANGENRQAFQSE